MKGPMMIAATTTDHDTDEDSEAGSRVTRSIIDHFVRRPSLEDRALEALSVMANNDLIMLGHDMEKPMLIDTACIFANKGQGRFLISGSSAVFHFEEGRLARRSSPQTASVIGMGSQYRPALDPPFELRNVDTAFLAASGGLVEAVSEEQIRQALNDSKTPEEWMNRLIELAGDREFCAITVFLPPKKASFLSRLRGRSNRA